MPATKIRVAAILIVLLPCSRGAFARAPDPRARRAGESVGRCARRSFFDSEVADQITTTDLRRWPARA